MVAAQRHDKIAGVIGTKPAIQRKTTPQFAFLREHKRVVRQPGLRCQQPACHAKSDFDGQFGTRHRLYRGSSRQLPGHGDSGQTQDGNLKDIARLGIALLFLVLFVRLLQADSVARVETADGAPAALAERQVDAAVRADLTQPEGPIRITRGRIKVDQPGRPFQGEARDHRAYGFGVRRAGALRRVPLSGSEPRAADSATQ